MLGEIRSLSISIWYQPTWTGALSYTHAQINTVAALEMADKTDYNDLLRKVCTFLFEVVYIQA